MMRLIAALLLVGTLSAPAVAQTVPVRSGEHAGYSRLVLDFEELPEWELVDTTEGASIQTALSGAAFDISSVFRTIPKTRIQGVRAPDGTGRLDIVLGCSCDFRAFAFGERRLVVDILDDSGPPPEVLAEVTATGRGVMADALQHEIAPDAAWPQYLSRTGMQIRRRGVSPAPQFPVAGADGMPRADLAPAESSAFARALATSLATELGAAVAEGVLDPSPPSSTHARQTRQGDLPGIRIETALERALGNPTDPPRDRRLGACFPDAWFDVAEWSAPDGIDGLGTLRAALYGGDGTVQPEAALVLARRLAALSFGAEARAVLDDFGLFSVESDVLRTLSDLVDDVGAGADTRLAGQVECQAASSLWAVLEDPDRAGEEALDPDLVVRTFSAMPGHLKHLLAPRLIRAFLDAGDATTARALRAVVARTPGPEPAALALVDADLFPDRGAREGGADEIAQLATSSAPERFDAMIRTVERALSGADPLPDGTADLLEALAREADSIPASRRLLSQSVRVRLSDGDLATAMADIRLFEATERLSRPEALLLTDKLVETLTAGSSDAEFTRWLFGAAAPDILEASAPQTRRQALARLQSLGFWRRATDLGAVPGASDRDPPAVIEPPLAPATHTAPDPDAPPLASARALLEESANTRAKVGAVLAGD